MSNVTQGETINIAILGTGKVGTALAKALSQKGHTLAFGSREPEKHQGLAAPVVDLSTAINRAELIVNAMPGSSALDTFRPLEDAVANKILLDVSNAVTPKFELVYPNSSIAAKLQEALPDAKVVKSLNTMNTSVMTAPNSLAVKTTIFLSGNDNTAKATVSNLLADLGWPKESQLDLGDISTASGPEHYFLLFFAMVRALKTPTFNISVVAPKQN